MMYSVWERGGVSQGNGPQIREVQVVSRKGGVVLVGGFLMGIIAWHFLDPATHRRIHHQNVLLADVKLLVRIF